MLEMKSNNSIIFYVHDAHSFQYFYNAYIRISFNILNFQNI